MNFTLHLSAVVDDGATIGEGSHIWHFAHICGGAIIGKNVSIGQGVFVSNRVNIGDNCKIQNNVSVYDGVTLEDGVFCGPSCVFTNVHNPRSEITRKDEYRKTVVRRGASIGANATIVCGHDLGAYCFIAAGATVTKEVPPHALMAGTPAKRIGWMSRAGGRLGDNLVCPEDGTQYRQISENQIEEVTSE